MTLGPTHWKYDVTSKIRVYQSMHISYLKNNRAKFHPDVFWNDGALGLFWRASQQQQEQQVSK